MMATASAVAPAVAVAPALAVAAPAVTPASLNLATALPRLEKLCNFFMFVFAALNIYSNVK